MTQLETGAQQLGVMMTRGYVHNAWPLAPPWPPLRFPFLSSVPTVKRQCTHCLNSQCSGMGCSLEGACLWEARLGYL